MGISCMSSSDGVVTAPNPNPKKYKPQAIRQQRGYTLLVVDYPGCTTYKGRKILLYKGHQENKLRSAVSIDPHFGLQKLAPVARFTPTHAGVIALELVIGPVSQYIKDLCAEVI